MISLDKQTLPYQGKQLHKSVTSLYDSFEPSETEEADRTSLPKEVKVNW